LVHKIKVNSDYPPLTEKSAQWFTSLHKRQYYCLSLIYLDIILNPFPTSTRTGQVKVSNPTPETRSQCWMGSGEGRGRIVVFGQPKLVTNHFRWAHRRLVGEFRWL